MKTGYYALLGELVLGSRFRKISERILLEIGSIYKSLNIEFEPGWFHILYLLDENETLSVTEISDTLQVSHPSVIQVVKVLENRALVSTTTDKTDKRKRLVKLTAGGTELLSKIKPLWNDIRAVVAALLEEGTDSAKLLSGITQLEENLDRKSLVERMELNRKAQQS